MDSGAKPLVSPTVTPSEFFPLRKGQPKCPYQRSCEIRWRNTYAAKIKVTAYSVLLFLKNVASIPQLGWSVSDSAIGLEVQLRHPGLAKALCSLFFKVHPKKWKTNDQTEDRTQDLIRDWQLLCMLRIRDNQLHHPTCLIVRCKQSL